MSVRKLKDMTPRERNKRVAELSKDPRTRSAIPTAYLKGFAGADKLRAKRAQKERFAAPFVPGGDLSYGDVAREREAATNLQFRPRESAIREAFEASDQRQRQSTDWFGAYKAELQKLQGEQAARQATTAQQLQGFGQDAQQQDTAMAQQLNAEMQKAAPEGVNFDPAGEANARAVQSADVRRRLNDSFGSMVTAQNAAAADLTTARRSSVAPMMELQERTREGARRQDIADEQRDLARDQGDFRTSYMADRRDSERKSVLERQVFGAETDLKRGVDPVTGKPLPADPSSKKTEADLDFFKEHGYYPPTGPPKKDKPQPEKYGYPASVYDKMSRDEKLRAKREWESNGKGGKNGQGTPRTEPESSLTPRRRLRSIKRDLDARGFKTREEAKAYYKKNSPHLFAPDQQPLLSAALDLKYDTRISRANLRGLRDEGVYVTSTGAYWRGGNRGA